MLPHRAFAWAGLRRFELVYLGPQASQLSFSGRVGHRSRRPLPGALPAPVHPPHHHAHDHRARQSTQADEADGKAAACCCRDKV
jgi:hypothetical protein